VYRVRSPDRHQTSRARGIASPDVGETSSLLCDTTRHTCTDLATRVRNYRGTLTTRTCHFRSDRVSSHVASDRSGSTDNARHIRDSTPVVDGQKKVVTCVCAVCAETGQTARNGSAEVWSFETLCVMSHGSLACLHGVLGGQRTRKRDKVCELRVLPLLLPEE
jgi:hypothetical protein